MTKTDAAVQTLSDINPDVVLEVNLLPNSFRYCQTSTHFVNNIFEKLANVIGFAVLHWQLKLEHYMSTHKKQISFFPMIF